MLEKPVLIPIERPRLGAIKDLKGQRVGRLTITEFVGTYKVINSQGHRINNLTLWLCRCNCGNTVEVDARHLKSNGGREATRSCGCLRNDAVREHCSRITEPQVMNIRRRARAGEPVSQIAEEFGITAASVSAIVKHKRWS